MVSHSPAPGSREAKPWRTGFTASTTGPGTVSEPRAEEMCGPAGPDNISEASCRKVPNPLYCRQLPLRLASGGSVLGRLGAVLCASA